MMIHQETSFDCVASMSEASDELSFTIFPTLSFANRTDEDFKSNLPLEAEEKSGMIVHQETSFDCVASMSKASDELSFTIFPTLPQKESRLHQLLITNPILNRNIMSITLPKRLTFLNNKGLPVIITP